jgi:hypothetical protein
MFQAACQLQIEAAFGLGEHEFEAQAAASGNLFGSGWLRFVPSLMSLEV